MAALTIRNLDDSVKAKLRVRAAHNGRSMEAEVRAILSDALGDERASPHSAHSPRKVAETGTTYAPPSEPEAAARQGDRLTWETVDDESLNEIIHAGPPEEDLASYFRRVFGTLGGIELELPSRAEYPRIPDFSGPEWDFSEDETRETADANPRLTDGSSRRADSKDTCQ